MVNSYHTFCDQFITSNIGSSGSKFLMIVGASDVDLYGCFCSASIMFMVHGRNFKHSQCGHIGQVLNDSWNALFFSQILDVLVNNLQNSSK